MDRISLCPEAGGSCVLRNASGYPAGEYACVRTAPQCFVMVDVSIVEGRRQVTQRWGQCVDGSASAALGDVPVAEQPGVTTAEHQSSYEKVLCACGGLVTGQNAVTCI